MITPTSELSFESQAAVVDYLRSNYQTLTAAEAPFKLALKIRSAAMETLSLEVEGTMPETLGRYKGVSAAEIQKHEAVLAQMFKPMLSTSVRFHGVWDAAMKTQVMGITGSGGFAALLASMK